jgi:hypothetical protein
MTVEGNPIIQASRQLREDWEERFADMAKQGDDQLLDETFPTQWDEED